MIPSRDIVNQRTQPSDWTKGTLRQTSAWRGRKTLVRGQRAPSFASRCVVSKYKKSVKK